MVCYARPVSMMTAIVLVVFVVFGKPTVHFFGTAALVVAVTVALAAAAVAAALVFAAAVPARRRRVAAGGCVTCQFRCQHAMTGPPGRSWLVSTVDREQATPVPAHRAVAGGPGPRTLLSIQPVAHPPVRLVGHAAAHPPVQVAAHAVTPRAVGVPARPVPPPSVRDNGFEGFKRVPAGPVPRWPDRPVHRAGQALPDQALPGQRAT
jgi:hypothetical protein